MIKKNNGKEKQKGKTAMGSKAIKIIKIKF